MTEEKVTDVVLRPKRQLTLPEEMCAQLGIGPGDVLGLTVEGLTLFAKLGKVVALEAPKRFSRLFSNPENRECASGDRAPDKADSC